MGGFRPRANPPVHNPEPLHEPEDYGYHEDPRELSRGEVVGVVAVTVAAALTLAWSVMTILNALLNP